MNLEQDLNGKDQHQPGAKLDADKNRLGLVLGGFSRALQAVGRVGTFGATKYTDNGWMSVERGQERYTDAMLRHVFKELEGEVTDPESGIEHAAHAVWNALARLELMLREREQRPQTSASVVSSYELRGQPISIDINGELGGWPIGVDINGHIQP